MLEGGVPLAGLAVGSWFCPHAVRLIVISLISTIPHFFIHQNKIPYQNIPTVYVL